MSPQIQGKNFAGKYLVKLGNFVNFSYIHLRAKKCLALKVAAAAAAAVAAGHTTVPACATPQRGCIGRHLASRSEMRVSGSDSYALLFLS